MANEIWSLYMYIYEGERSLETPLDCDYHLTRSKLKESTCHDFKIETMPNMSLENLIKRGDKRGKL